MIRINLLKIDMDAGKNWMARVHEVELKRSQEAIRAKHRAAWLDQQGRHDEAERLRARHDVPSA